MSNQRPYKTAQTLYNLAQFYKNWKCLEWEHIMDNLTRIKNPAPSLLELSFRQLSFCQFRPRKEAMRRDLNYLARVCTSHNAVHFWTARKKASVISSCSLLGYLSPLLLGRLWQDMRDKDELVELNAIELVAVVKALGLLGELAMKKQSLLPCGIFFGVSELLLEVVKRLMEEQILASLSNRHIAEIWRGLGRLRFYDTTYLRLLARETTKPPRLQRYEESAMMTMLFSTAILRYRERAFITTLLEACIVSHRLKCYESEELATMYQSLALMHVHHEGTLQALDTELCKSHRLTDLTAQQIAVILSASGVLKWFNESFIKAIATEISKEKRQESFSKSGLSYIRFAFTKINNESESIQLKEAVLRCADGDRVKILKQRH